jgi:hypothetical protein
MSFTETKVGTYGFHEQTLSDRAMPITNTTTRTLLNNELVIFGGVFGNVLATEGIGAAATGLVNINSERSIKTNQLADGADFAVGGTVYIVAGTNDAPAGLTNSSAGNTAIGIVVEIDPADIQLYVVFRPFSQFTETAGLQAEIDALDAIVALNPIKVAKLVVAVDASAGLAFANVDTGLAVGDEILNIIAHSDGDVVSATVTLSHGGVGGAAITGALDIATGDASVQATSVVGGTVTADGLVATTNGATAVCTLYVMYIPA